MPVFQLPENAMRLLQTGEMLLYGNRPDNVVVAEVLGPGHAENSTRVRLLEDYDTNRKNGNSFRAAGAELTALPSRLWLDT